jgi:hypothetical protein
VARSVDFRRLPLKVASAKVISNVEMVSSGGVKGVAGAGAGTEPHWTC